ncbi:MAG TPA: ATP-dependent DNA helicase [Candidatus Saccharimonadales bacterium]|nr:ATP-dependent DNA helicase [Candidatus Saccharimonadales bacterium]
MGQFEVAYKQLNEQQRTAVDAIDGPVLVVAGPGTGKTQLLSVRVANILKKTDAAAANILCLTFTNKAASNMRDRLLELIGPASHGVTVRTFHSFAAEIMTMYPDYFWNGARLSTAPDAVQLETVRDILSKLPLDNPLALKFAGAYTAISDVQQALKLAKEAGLTPDKLRAMIDVNLAYIDTIEPQLVQILEPVLSTKKLPQLSAAIEALPDQPLEENISPLISLSTVLKESLAEAIRQDEGSGKTAFTGKWKQRWLQTVDGQKGMYNERKRNAWWRAAGHVYETYRDELHGRGYYDYADMIIEVITQLEHRGDMRADVQERFQYVLIDEFQDTNAAQLRLAHLVADHYANLGKPNLMAVGDDDQSIFAFNGAELSNMLSFRRSYPSTKMVILTDNYRSSQAVLDTAKDIIEQAEDRLVNRETNLSKNLKAVNPPTQKGVIEHISYPTREHQLMAVAKKIAARRQQGSGSVAVLARTHDSLKQIASQLLKLKVPVKYEQQTNILEHEAVRQISLIAEAVTAIQAGDQSAVNYNLAELLRHPMWQLKPRVLWRLAAANYAEPNWLENLLDHNDEQLNNIGNWLVWLAREADRLPLGLVIEYLLGLRKGQYLLSPFHDYYLTNRPATNEYLQALSATQVLQSLAQEFAGTKTANLTNFVQFLRLNSDLGRGISDESWFMSDEHAVQLLSVHKAKGLEFDSVYIVDAIEDVWKPRTGGRKPPANLPLQPYGENYDDYVRLMYVAASRAKHSLIISSYLNDSLGKELLAAPFIRNILPLQKVDKETVEQPIPVLESALAWPRLETKNEHALLQDRLENYQLTATGLIDFLNVAGAGPAYFLERHLLRLPMAKSATMAYGIAIHSSLETAQRLTNSHNFNLGTVLDRYEAALRDQCLLPVEFGRYLKHGEAILAQLFSNNLFSLPVGSLAEQNINDIRLGSASLKGKLDRIDLDLAGGNLTITDYKTGKPLHSFTTKDRAKATKAWKQRTQLAFYNLLASQSARFSKYPNINSQIIYVEAESSKDLLASYAPTAEELDHLSRLIEVVWRHIMDLNFPDISKYAPDDYSGIQAFQQDLIDGNT